MKQTTEDTAHDDCSACKHLLVSSTLQAVANNHEEEITAAKSVISHR